MQSDETGKNRRQAILVIDDEEVVRFLFDSLLQEECPERFVCEPECWFSRRN